MEHQPNAWLPIYQITCAVQIDTSSITRMNMLDITRTGFKLTQAQSLGCTGLTLQALVSNI